MEQEADKLIGSHICYRIYQHSTSRGVSKNKTKRTTQQKPHYTVKYYNMI